MNIKELFNKYDENSNKLIDLNICKKDRIKSIVKAYGLAFLIVLSPLILLYNLFLYPQYHILIVGLISFLAFIYFTCSDIFYHNALKKYNERVKEISFKENYIINSTIYFVICTIIFIVAIFII